MAVTPANLQKSPSNSGFGFSEEPGNDLVSPDSKMGLKPPDPPAVLHIVPELSEDETMGLVPRASRLVKTLIKLKGETVESKPARPMPVESTAEIFPAAEQSEPNITGSHETSNNEAVEKAKEEASPVESKSNQSDENEEENAEMRKMKVKMRLKKMQTRIQKLHEDLIIHSKNAKSFSQSIQKELEAVNMLKGGGAGLAILSATCPQLEQASPAADGLQAAAKNARQVCASTTTQKSTRQVGATVKTKMSARQPCAHQNS